MDYSFGNYKLQATQAPVAVADGPAREAATPVGNGNQLTVATFNVENLDPTDPQAKFDGLARVIVDNLRAHHTDGARAAIEARGARLWHLPLDSPDFNPIQHAFSKVKQSLRRAAARTDDALRAATWTAFAAITRTDAASWFAHCGYHA